MLECISRDEYQNLETINGIGQSIIDDIKNFFTNQNNLKVIKELAGDGISSGIVTVTDVAEVSQGLLQGKSIVFTGTLTKFTRDEAKEAAERLGARAASSVSAKTFFVVAGENAGKKLEEAKKLGIKIISEEDFIKNWINLSDINLS